MVVRDLAQRVESKRTGGCSHAVTTFQLWLKLPSQYRKNEENRWIMHNSFLAFIMSHSLTG